MIVHNRIEHRQSGASSRQYVEVGMTVGNRGFFIYEWPNTASGSFENLGDGGWINW